MGREKASLTQGKETPGKLMSLNMTMNRKADLLPKLRARYEWRGRAGKTRMLDELSEDYGYERKYAIKLVEHIVPVRNAPPPWTGSALHVDRTGGAHDLAGGRAALRQTAGPAQPLWLRHYERHHDALSAPQRQRLREKPSGGKRARGKSATNRPAPRICG